ncbi:MAG: sodium:proton antiporter [Verrucomicrobium sp.]|nr:sodium:proton antiporter [Verrucomicrobium sp.]
MAAGTPVALQPHPTVVLPFVALLLCIALLPLAAPHFWERHYPKVSIGLGLMTAGYYIQVLHHGQPILHSIQEYVSFMALIGSLFVISGGINIQVKGEATPVANTLFLLFGAVIANLIGTTGASMLLIRPWIRMNKYRITKFHVVFFIFLVSNVGGALTPIGDPPLYLGYLRGVPFWWVMEHVWSAWLLTVVLLLAVFYFMDRRNFARAPQSVAKAETAAETWQFRGVHHLAFLLLVLLAVFLPPQWKVGTEAFSVNMSSLLMVTAAAASYFTTPKTIHEANDFSFGPVKEVAFLFIGIFLTMVPALELLGSGQGIHLTTPLQYYFTSGSLSAFLDNAPTYLTFLAAAMGNAQLDVGNAADVRTFLQSHPAYVVAISLGAVFFGAGSYIGNGPNFMVKAIAGKAKVHTPGFLGYLFHFSLPILVPILVVVGWIMMR